MDWVVPGRYLLDSQLDIVPDQASTYLVTGERSGTVKESDETSIILDLDENESAVDDAYKRLMAPSISTEFLNLAKEKADEYSIGILT